MPESDVPRLAYLISRYPSLSHTFILREVLGLRASGLEIETASINDPDRDAEQLTQLERDAAETTFFVKRHGAIGAIRPHLRTLLRAPFSYVRGLLVALRLGGSDPRELLRWIFYFVEAVIVGDWMLRRGLDHVHVHFGGPVASVGLLVSRTFPVDFSLMIHGPDELYDVTGFRLREKLEQARFVSCIGRFALSQVLRISAPESWDKFDVTPLGVDPQTFSPQARPAGDGTFEVLCVGRLVPAKGQHVLLAALARLVDDGRTLRLRLVGDGPDRASLERDVEARGLGAHVVFEGAVNQDGIRDAYARADVFALASFAEGIPVVLMEAMAMELPCVTTWIAGIAELIRDSQDGLLVAPADPEALAAAIARLMDRPELRAELGRQGRKRVLERYCLEPNIARLAELLQRRLAPGAPRPTQAR